MDAETIAGLVGLAMVLLVLIALSIFESRTYRREHDGEGMLHHWVTHHTICRIGGVTALSVGWLCAGGLDRVISASP